jgi:hypothetical protein
VWTVADPRLVGDGPYFGFTDSRYVPRPNEVERVKWKHWHLGTERLAVYDAIANRARRFRRTPAGWDETTGHESGAFGRVEFIECLREGQ